MATSSLPIPINKPAYAFPSRKFYTFFPQIDGLFEAEVGLPYGERKVFQKFSGLEEKDAIRKHRESGSQIPWLGDGTTETSPFTLTRGLGHDPTASNAPYEQLLKWKKSRAKMDFFLDLFMREGDASPIKQYTLTGVKPTRYKTVDLDVDSEDTLMEELECELEDWDVFVA